MVLFFLSLLGCAEIQDATWCATRDVLLENCYYCHSGEANDFRLYESYDESNPAGVATSEMCETINNHLLTDNGEPLIIPGDADGSALDAILKGTHPDVLQMPLSQDPLPDDELNVIRLWIESGANCSETCEKE